jgi:hypothetical protein
LDSTYIEIFLEKKYSLTLQLIEMDTVRFGIRISQNNAARPDPCRVIAEELTSFYDDVGMRCERDAFDTLFDHAPDKLQVRTCHQFSFSYSSFFIKFMKQGGLDFSFVITFSAGFLITLPSTMPVASSLKLVTSLTPFLTFFAGFETLFDILPTNSRLNFDFFLL